MFLTIISPNDDASKTPPNDLEKQRNLALHKLAQLFRLSGDSV